VHVLSVAIPNVCRSFVLSRCDGQLFTPLPIPSNYSARVDEKITFFVVCSSLSSSTSGMGEERQCTASTAGEGCEVVFGGLRDLVQLSTSLIVSARGRLSVSGSSSAKNPVTIASAENTMPGTQLAYLPCRTIFKQV